MGRHKGYQRWIDNKFKFSCLLQCQRGKKIKDIYPLVSCGLKTTIFYGVA